MDVVSQQEQANKRKGRTVSIVVHIGILLLALLPILTFPDPPPGQEGILVNLGLPDEGQGEENAPEADAPEAVEEESEPVEEEVIEEEVEEVEEVEEAEPEVKKPEPVEEKKVVETEDPEALALKKKREKEKEEAKKKEEARKKAEAKKKAEAEKKRKEEEARKKAAAEKAKREAEAKALKDKLSGAFGGGDGDGKGNTGTSGNQGDPNGDPNSKNLEGISTGSGTVGGGLGSRGVLNSPRVSENSQKSGKVVLKVCVDGTGKVVSAEYTQRGSTTSDSQLKAAAIRNAKKWRFNKGAIDKQCGTITYNFKVR